MQKIIRNRARCFNCGDIIESTSVHNYEGCSCGEIAVDGGLEYLKRNWMVMHTGGGYEELSEWSDDDAEV